MASATQQVSDAVTALHGPSAEQRDAANHWLLEFLNSDAAWEAGVALLDAGHGGQLQFFGANMVLVKVRGAWAKLAPEAQAQLTAAVRWVAYNCCHYSLSQSICLLNTVRGNHSCCLRQHLCLSLARRPLGMPLQKAERNLGHQRQSCSAPQTRLTCG